MRVKIRIDTHGACPLDCCQRCPDRLDHADWHSGLDAPEMPPNLCHGPTLTVIDHRRGSGELLKRLLGAMSHKCRDKEGCRMWFRYSIGKTTARGRLSAWLVMRRSRVRLS